MSRKFLAMAMVLILLCSGSTVFAAPLVSQSVETGNVGAEKGDLHSSSTLAASQAAQNQDDIESLSVGEISDEALWIGLGVIVVLGIVLVAS